MRIKKIWIFVIVFAFILFREPITKMKIISISLALAMLVLSDKKQEVVEE